MALNRCPWCGKEINRFNDQQNVKKIMTPRNFRFARCSHCRKFYGQNVKSKRISFCFMSMLVLLILGLFLENGYIALLSLFFVPIALFSPLEKMTKDETGAEYEETELSVKVQESYMRLKLKKLYFLTDTFNDNESFSVASPFYFYGYNKRDKEFSARFIYNHFQNNEYVNKDNIKIYDSKMRLVAVISIRARSCE